MHRFTTILSAVLLLTATASAQSWRQQYPPQLAQARDLEVLSGVNVWVAHSDGTLRHTTDGGVNWTSVAPGAARLDAVHFVSGSVGWVAGDGIWRTTDAGQAWTRTSTASVHALAFPDALSGWAAATDGRVLRTSDGGQTWTQAVQFAGAPALDDVHALAGGLVWACGSGGALFASADSGANWTAVATGTTADLTAVHFTSATRGWIAAGAQIRATTDGGTTWSVQANPSGEVIEDLFFLTDQRGWACGRAGARLSTTDGGANWSPAGGAAIDLAALEFADFLRGYAVGAAGTVVRTEDGGANWTTVAGGSPVAVPVVRGLSAVDADRAWATTTSDAILRTTDGGDTWTPVPVGVNFQWRDVHFVDALNGYACGEKQAFFPAIAWTHDGGLSWNSVYYSMMVDFNAVVALSPTTALVTGSTFVWRTTNGGASWPSVTPLPYGTYHGMDFVDANTGWIAGSQIFRTDNGGATWTLQLTPPLTMYDVGFADPLNGWCVGANATVLRTTNGGQTWTSSTIPLGGTLREISVVDAAHLWVAGDDGYVVRSIDGGASWALETPGLPSGAQPATIEFVSRTDGWIGGGAGQMGLWARRGVPCTTPASYCTAKVNSLGQMCTLGSVGSPEYLGDGFDITYQGARPNQFAVLIYSPSGPAAAPFLGGTRCVATPIIRSGTFLTGSTGAGVAPITLLPHMIGTTRWYQIFYRDPPAADGTGAGLSDGLEVRFCG